MTPTLFVAWDDYVSATRAANPDATTVLPSVIGARPAAGISADDLAVRINAASDEADALTRAEAAAETPGVADVQRSFDVIFLLFALVVPLVTGLFFLIITLQKARALTLLRAIGAPAGSAGALAAGAGGDHHRGRRPAAGRCSSPPCRRPPSAR